MGPGLRERLNESGGYLGIFFLGRGASLGFGGGGEAGSSKM